MIPTQRWRLRLPLWAALAASGLGVAAFLSLWLACGPYAAVGLPAAVAWFCARRPGRGAYRSACLELDPVHGWMLQCGTERRRLRLLRAWPACGWVSLRFAASPPSGSGGPAIDRGQGAKPWTLPPAWQGAAAFLRFGRAPVSKENMLELTVWKSAVPAEGWRRLRVAIAGLPARPAVPARSAAP